MIVNYILIIMLLFAYTYMSIFLLAYFMNIKKKDPMSKNKPSVSVLIPAYNEEKSVAETLKHVIEMKKSYGKNFEIIFIDNNSKDNTLKIAKQFEKAYSFIRVIQETKKQGKSFALNTGIKEAKNDIIVTIDADSYPKKDSLNYMVGYLDNPKYGAVATKLKVKNPKTFIEKFQNIEYFYSNFFALSLEFLDSVFIARGPLSAFRRDVLLKIGGFIDPKITQSEDMEITFRIKQEGYLVAVSKNAMVETNAMPTWKALYKQRMRWNVGTLKTIFLHKNFMFNLKHNIFGLVVFPILAISYIFLFIVLYTFINTIKANYHTIYAFFWNLSNGIPIDFTVFNIVFSNPLFFVSFNMFFVLVSIIILLTSYYYAFKESGAKLSNSWFSFILYNIVFYIYLFVLNILGIFKFIFRKSVSWR